VHILTPSNAAAIARGVYRLREDSVSTVHDRGQTLGCEDMFSVTDDSRFEGRSGGLAWKRLSGFGYIADGVGPYAGEVLVATRGTAMSLDWLSNLNIGMQFGPGGFPVHAGFHDVWKSYQADLRTFFRGRNPSRVHCVGHSLGGALASLNADYLTANAVADVALYTFGSPRTGDGLFARSLTRRVTPAKLYRVAHPADPVPMIPLFPFWHLPHNRVGLTIARTDSALISVGAHSMEGSYIPGVTNRDWSGLARGDNGADESARAKSWLEQAAEGKSSVLKGSARALTMIGSALRWLLARARDLLVGAIGVTLTAGATVLDQLAWLLSKGAQLSKELAGGVKTLVGAIFRFLGRAVSATVSITVTFLRWVLDLLFTSLRAVAVRALAIGT